MSVHQRNGFEEPLDERSLRKDQISQKSSLKIRQFSYPNSEELESLLVHLHRDVDDWNFGVCASDAAAARFALDYCCHCESQLQLLVLDHGVYAARSFDRDEWNCPALEESHHWLTSRGGVLTHLDLALRL